ncbi:MAG TPA: hypothetical protein VEQ37_05415 [Actinomycetota bacterium]|nr:hypothetical protein [Actinomycetota bacterium]
MLLDTLRRELTELGATVRLQAQRRVSTFQVDALLEVELDGTREIFAVEQKARAPYPSEVGSLDPLRTRLQQIGAPLLAAPHISEGQGSQLITHGWSWADGLGNFDLRAGSLRLRQRLPGPRPTRGHRSLPRGPGGLAIVRALIFLPSVFADPRLGRRRLAAAADVTLPRVSQVLKQLAEAEIIRGDPAVTDQEREALLDAFLAEYRGPGGEEDAYFSLKPLQEVARNIGRRTHDREAVVSADIGPDLIVPVRSPTMLIAYVSRPFDVSSLDLTPAEGRGDANVLIRRPADTSVFGPKGTIRTAVIREARVRLADPTQMIWDLRDLGGADRLEAADRLRKWLLGSR